MSNPQKQQFWILEIEYWRLNIEDSHKVIVFLRILKTQNLIPDAEFLDIGDWVLEIHIRFIKLHILNLNFFFEYSK